MANPVAPATRGPLLWIIDPRRSLVTGAVWLIIALAATVSIAAGIWVGAIARRNLLEQHVRRLLLETDQLSSESVKLSTRDSQPCVRPPASSVIAA